MHICHVSPGLTPISPHYADAPNSIIKNLSVNYARMGHDVTILSLEGGNFSQDRVNVRELEIPDFTRRIHAVQELVFGFKAVYYLDQVISDQEFDIVHFHNPVPPALVSVFHTKLKMPVVYTNGNPNLGITKEVKTTNKLFLARELNYSELPYWISLGSLYAEQSAFNSVDGIIAVSERLRENIITYFRIDPEKIAFIPNGVDTNIFRPSIPEQTLLQSLHLENRRIVLCLARIAPYKNQLTLIKAIPDIIREFPDVKFLFVGPISPKYRTYFETIQAFVRARDLEDHVMFTGTVEAGMLPKLYNLADIFVLPSLSEGMPLVLLEAMSCGKAIIASSIDQNREVAVKGDEICFVNTGRTTEIVEAVRLLLSDQLLKRTMESVARRTALDHFDWKIIADRTVKMYEEIITARP